jgi:hypothetical protein
MMKAQLHSQYRADKECAVFVDRKVLGFVERIFVLTHAVDVEKLYLSHSIVLLVFNRAQTAHCALLPWTSLL